MSVLTPSQTGTEPKVLKLTTRIVRGWDGYEATEPHWRRLFEKTRGADPQAVWPLVQHEYSKYRRDYIPLTVTVFDGGELCAIVPLLEPKRKLFKPKKNIKMLGYDSTEFGMHIVASDPKATWDAVELQLREHILKTNFEAIVLRRPSAYLGPGAYVTDFPMTKQLRKVRPMGASMPLTETIEMMATPKAAAWMPTFEQAELKHSSFDDLGDAIELLRRFVPNLEPSFAKQLTLLAEEGDGFVAWLEQDAQVVAAQAFIQTQDLLAVLAGGGSGLAQLQLKVFRTAHAQGVERVRFLSTTDDWLTLPAGLVEDVVVARV